VPVYSNILKKTKVVLEVINIFQLWRGYSWSCL